MKRPMKFLNIITCVIVLLPASLAMAQQATPQSSLPMQMQSPVATQASPSLQPNEQNAQPMQKMDKMADSVTKMSEMCQMANHTRASGIAHAMNEKPLLIGGLAKLSGVRPDTIRFYERIGLLPKPSRTASGYRVYADAALSQVRFIRKAQSLGFSLDEIRRIMSLRGQGKETCRCVISMAEATLAETETKRGELRKFKDTLATNLTRWKRKRRGPIAAEFCALIEASS